MRSPHVFFGFIIIVGSIAVILEACMSMGGGGAEVPITTTVPTPQECEDMPGQVVMFQQNDNEFQPEVWGAVPASGKFLSQIFYFTD